MRETGNSLGGNHIFAGKVHLSRSHATSLHKRIPAGNALQDVDTEPSNASRRPVGGGVICDLCGLEEEVLFLFERSEFCVEAFQQGEHPFFAVVDLLSDLLSGAFDPVDLEF